jgi:hypothetical protein
VNGIYLISGVECQHILGHDRTAGFSYVEVQMKRYTIPDMDITGHKYLSEFRFINAYL